MMKSIIISGTKRDLGLAIAQKLTENDIQVIDINDYDFTNKSDLDLLFNKLRLVKDDIYGCINNSYADGYGQLEFLFRICDYFGNNSKLIINLGSVNKDRLQFDKIDQIKYSVYKQALYECTNKLKKLYPKQNIICLNLNMCNTSYNKNKPGEKIEPEIIANQIFEIINA